MHIPIETSRPTPSQARLLLRCFAFLRPHWKITAAAYLSMLAIDALNMLNPQLLSWAIDKGILASDFSLLGLASGALLGLVIVKGVLSYIQGRGTEVASQNVAYDLRNELQRKITQLSFSFHDQAQAGDLLSRAIQDVERIRFLTGRATYRVVEGVVMMLATAVVMLLMNPRLALLAVLCIPLLAYQSIRFGKAFRPLSRLIQDQLAVLTTRVEQNLRGARVVKTFAQEEQEIEHFEAENRHWFDLSSTSARLQAVNMPLLQWIANISSVAILLYGGMLVIDGKLTIGELVAFTTYMGQLVTPVRFLGMILPAISMATASAERIFEILDEVPEVYERPDAATLTVKQGCVRFENVSFSYGQNRVLREIDFEAEPNQMVALLGLTGSGKTSIVNLIPRFYDPTDGCITIDGVDIRSVTLASLRAQIGMVLQETTLFEASIRENIRFGRPDAGEEEVIAAAKAAQAHDFILESVDGYDTLVGERGATLSGGQKQRLAIARALLTDPRILILDDATSSVDSETEYQIQLALERLMHGRTTFVIAHRLSTVQHADLILVLDKGRIAARGRHEELLKSSPLYAGICRQQLKG